MTPKLFFLYLLAFLLCSCAINQPTPSKQRLESATDIRLPATFSVLKDEFQDMGQDYAVYYDLQFEPSSMKDLCGSIKNSRFYHSNGSSAMYSDSLSSGEPNNFSIWFPAPKGYEFNGKDGAVLYRIRVDTIVNTLNYHEYVL